MVVPPQELVDEGRRELRLDEDTLVERLAQDAAREAEALEVLRGEHARGVRRAHLVPRFAVLSARRHEEAVLRVEDVLAHGVHPLLEQAAAVDAGLLHAVLVDEGHLDAPAQRPRARIAAREPLEAVLEDAAPAHADAAELGAAAVQGHAEERRALQLRRAEHGLVRLDQALEDGHARLERQQVRHVPQHAGDALVGLGPRRRRLVRNVHRSRGAATAKACILAAGSTPRRGATRRRQRREHVLRLVQRLDAAVGHERRRDAVNGGARPDPEVLAGEALEAGVALEP
mmetsp:Transcript_26634/g.83355  ORF Transcript_26634/g.83355 Transcript_26634/m.83355 type:complete len:287 (-) Transcript_26634:804-1664(-)